MNYPLTSNPLVLIYRGHVPSLKNNRQVFTGKDGTFHRIGRSAGVNRFLKLSATQISIQCERQGFDQIAMPELVGVYARIGVCPPRKTLVPNSDLDNSYTTLQETWQGCVIDDDRQVTDYHVSRFLVASQQLEYAMVFLWVLDKQMFLDDPFYGVKQFIKFYDFLSHKKLNEMVKW